jgi:hypothetical protein
MVPCPLSRQSRCISKAQIGPARQAEVREGVVEGMAPRLRGSEGTLRVRGQPRTNTFHHPEKLLCQEDDDEPF